MAIKSARITLKLTAIMAAAVICGTLLGGAMVNADSTTSNSNTGGSSTNSCSNSSSNQTKLNDIITKGNEEIARRLTNLSNLTSLINSTTKLSSSDKTTLSDEVSSTISGLTSLKTQLDSETNICSARTDVANIYTEYRVYALVDPKVHIVKVADDQQATETKLSSMSTQLQTRITADQNAGKNVTTLQSDLTDMNNQVQAASSISASVETNVIGLQPSDYNSNHAVLSGYNSQLETAHSDVKAAVADAKEIVSGLKSL